MQTKYGNVIWAVILIGLGAVLLAQNFGYLDQFGWQLWAIILGALSVLFLATYLLSGIRNWGWLFPALICGALAGMLVLGGTGTTSSAIAAPLMVSIGAPFVVAFALNPRQHWWALIPAWVMAVLTMVLLVADRAAGEVIGALVMFGIGAPFLIVYFTDRTRWWALIPGGVLAGLGVVILATTQVTGEAMGTVVMLILALPFVAVYAASPTKNWWALIPAGSLASVAVLVWLVAGRDISADLGARLSGVLFLGVGLTFGLLWLQRATIPTGWAIYPAGGFGVLAVATFALGERIELVWPLVLIGLGALMLLASLRPRRAG